MATLEAAESQVLATTTTSAKFTNAMAVGKRYRCEVSTASWVTVAVTGGSADAAAGNHLVVPGAPVYLKAETATIAFVHVEALSGTGFASLSAVEG